MMRTLIALLLLAATASTGWAQGETVLTVRSAGAAQTFSVADLEKLATVEVTTTTPWTEGPQTFRGVPATALIAATGLDGAKTVRAVALNDYAVEIPVADFAAHEVIVAIYHNGQRMRVRDKGPLWIVYPAGASDHAAPEIRDRMIWQLKEIVAR